MQNFETDHGLLIGSITPNPDMLSTELDGDVVLMSAEQGRYYALDAVASSVWRRLDAAPTGEALIADLVADFQGNSEQIRADVLALLRNWLKEGLVRVDA